MKEPVIVCNECGKVYPVSEKSCPYCRGDWKMNKIFLNLAVCVIFVLLAVGCSVDTTFNSGYIVDVTCYSGGDVVIAEQALYSPLSAEYFRLDDGEVGNRVEYSEENCVFVYRDIVSISRDGERWEIDDGR